MYKSLTLYSVTESLDPEVLNEQFSTRKFRPCGGLEKISAGFVPFADGLPLVHSVHGMHVGAVRVDKKTIPASAVKQMVKEECAKIEEQQGYKPGRKQIKEIKEQVLDTLLPRAIPSTSIIQFMFTRDLLLIETTSASSADLVIGLLAKCIDPMPISLVYTAQSPGAAMTQWLVENEAPEAFAISREAEMKAPSKAMVRWANDSVRAEEAQEHRIQGKQCTKLALSWRDKYSFVLNDKMVISKIKPLDLHNPDAKELDPEDVDGAIMLFGTECVQLAHDLIEALGGLCQDSA